MVILAERFYKIYSKLENHHNHDNHQEPQKDALAVSLQAFRFEVSSYITQLLLNYGPGLGNLSLSWIEQCFKLLPMINKAFAKLVLDINYPMIKWEAKFKEEYLNYSLRLLDLLNLVRSSISHLGQAKLSLSHALSLVETSPASAVEWLKPMEIRSLFRDLKDQEMKEEEKGSSCMDKEMVMSQALMELKGIGLWVCCVALAGLSGDSKVYLEMKKMGSVLCSPLLVNLDSAICMEKGCELKEVKEVNEAAVQLSAALEAGGSGGNAAEELERKLKGFEKLLDAIGMEVEAIFSGLLAARCELLDCIRLQ